eukprot:gene11418-28481_t
MTKAGAAAGAAPALVAKVLAGPAARRPDAPSWASSAPPHDSGEGVGSWVPGGSEGDGVPADRRESGQRVGPHQQHHHDDEGAALPPTGEEAQAENRLPGAGGPVDEPLPDNEQLPATTAADNVITVTLRRRSAAARCCVGRRVAAINGAVVRAHVDVVDATQGRTEIIVGFAGDDD